MRKDARGQLREAKRKNGLSWSVRVYLPDGRRVVEPLGRSWGAGAIDRREAERRAEMVMARVRLGVYETRDERRAKAQEAAPPILPTFEVFASEWLSRIEAVGGTRGTGLSESGRGDIEWRLAHANGWFGPMRIDEITPQEVDRFAAAKRAAPVGEGGLGPVSTNKVLSAIRRVLNDAVRYGLIPRNPADGVRVPAPKYRAAVLERADHVVALLDAAGKLDAERRRRRGHGRALLATLTFAGLRISEALALEWRDVDLARGELRVRDSKTAAGVRTVEILPALRDELAELKTRRPSDRTAFVFATTRGGKENAGNVRTRILAKAVEAANEALEDAGEEGISERLTLHGLRHSFASILVALGWDPRRVMTAIGHEDPAFTLRVYTKTIDRGDEERARLRALVNGEPLALPDRSVVDDPA